MINKKIFPDPFTFLSNLEKQIKEFDKGLRGIDLLLRGVDAALRSTSIEDVIKKLTSVKVGDLKTEDEQKYRLDEKTPIDIRFDVARTRLQRFIRAFENYKNDKSKENLDRVKRAFNKLREVYVCPGCAQMYKYIEELLPELEKNPDEVIPVIESYVEGLLFSIEATDVMIDKWGTVKPLEELSKEEKEELRREVEKRLEKMIEV